LQETGKSLLLLRLRAIGHLCMAHLLIPGNRLPGYIQCIFISTDLPVTFM